MKSWILLGTFCKHVTWTVLLVMAVGCNPYTGPGEPMVWQGPNYRGQTLLMTRNYQDVGDPNPRAQDTFGAGEVPVVFVRGYRGQTVAVNVVDMSNGNLVYENTFYMPEGKDMNLPLSGIAAGSYNVLLRVHGSVVKAYSFSVFK